jgi:hypothetical protein
LAGHVITDGAAPAASVTTARLLASTVDRLACWAADHTGIDLAYTAPPRPPELEHPVLLVRVPADLAAGQRQLETFLAPMATGNLHGRNRLSADTANTVALNQTVLLVDLRERIAVSAGLAGELPRIERLMDLFGQAVYSVRGLHDNTGPRVQRLLRGQQQEISVGVRRGHIGALSDRQVTDLLTATESTLSIWAAAVRREATRKTTSFRVGRRGTIDSPVYARIRSDGPDAAALTALAEATTRSPDKAEPVTTRGRDRLRETLTQTPPFESVENWPGPGRRHHHRTPAGHTPTATGPRH